MELGSPAPLAMKTYRVVELHGDGISPELSRSVHAVAEATAGRGVEDADAEPAARFALEVDERALVEIDLRARGSGGDGCGGGCGGEQRAAGDVLCHTR